MVGVSTSRPVAPVALREGALGVPVVRLHRGHLLAGRGRGAADGALERVETAGRRHRHHRRRVGGAGDHEVVLLHQVDDLRLGLGEGRRRPLAEGRDLCAGRGGAGAERGERVPVDLALRGADAGEALRQEDVAAHLDVDDLLEPVLHRGEDLQQLRQRRDVGAPAGVASAERALASCIVALSPSRLALSPSTPACAGAVAPGAKPATLPLASARPFERSLVSAVKRTAMDGDRAMRVSVFEEFHRGAGKALTNLAHGWRSVRNG